MFKIFEEKSSPPPKNGESAYKPEDMEHLMQFKEEVSKKLSIDASELKWEDMLLWHEVLRGEAHDEEIEMRERNVTMDTPFTEAQVKFYRYLRSKVHKTKKADG